MNKRLILKTRQKPAPPGNPHPAPGVGSQDLLGAKCFSSLQGLAQGLASPQAIHRTFQTLPPKDRGIYPTVSSPSAFWPPDQKVHSFLNPPDRPRQCGCARGAKMWGLATAENSPTWPKIKNSWSIGSEQNTPAAVDRNFPAQHLMAFVRLSISCEGVRS